MQLKSLHSFFQNGLIGYYPKEEINAFFYRICEQHLDYKRIDVSLKSETLITPETFEYFETIISRLLTYEPIQYILGTTSFFGLEFKVDANVLIPRPETEELVAWILKQTDSSQFLKILDIGTGSGCIAVSLAKHLPNAEVYALDVSPAALEMAQYNAQQNGVQIHAMEANVLEWATPELQFDIIVSNPPYVRESEKEFMAPNVLEHEPHLALFVENNHPLVFYKAIVELSKQALKKEGLLYFEINEYLGENTKALCSLDVFKDVQLKTDIFGKHRMMCATKC
ncbi:MAG: peptide chain release factor N(5)-glutamine methyltransferase [Flavobacteriaceae bacterium]|mgnify:CR=1 FL=1|nr:peptide chain release factor N(5)-glutamine methyltransferase [Flavobacteriaceae bacterium]MDG2498474.1 peptide chain release factor N(5)-glutamine methyltransferase [Flavobacteriaceae bacterium]